MLERTCTDAQDMEFTVERGCLFFLQTRTANRTPRAALKIAVDLANEGVIDRNEALKRLADVKLEAARLLRFAKPASAVAKAVVASPPSVACGGAAFTSDRAKETAARGEPAILVRRETSPGDVAGFAAAKGILTAVGGRTAHAAVVARELGKVCLVGCRALAIAEDEGAATIGETLFREGDWIALDGTTGEVSLGRRDIVEAEAPEAAIVRKWREDAARR